MEISPHWVGEFSLLKAEKQEAPFPPGFHCWKTVLTPGL